MDFENIAYELKDGIATITLNRPRKLNAINDAMLGELDALLAKIETDLEPRVVVFKGAGRAFSAGQDLSGVGTDEAVPPPPGTPVSFEELRGVERRRARRLEYIFNFPRPTIAQVHGHCLGAGCYLAMVCDLVIASEDAVFGDPALRMGMTSALPLWTWLIGIKKTNELLFLGRNMGAAEAEKFGLINKAVPKDELEKVVGTYARVLSIPPADGMPLVKESINAGLESRGVGAAWRFMNDMQVTAQQRVPGPGEFDFFRTRDDKGLKAAVEERDRAFKELGF